MLNRSLLPWIFRIQRAYPYLSDQLKRASLSIQLNLAEGVGRLSSRDKKQFYIRARASVNECVSILQTMQDLGILDQDKWHGFYASYEKVSKMLLGMIRKVA